MIRCKHCGLEIFFDPDEDDKWRHKCPDGDFYSCSMANFNGPNDYGNLLATPYFKHEIAKLWLKSS